MVTGTACGVVLGGSGPRGFAHLGVLRAFTRSGPPMSPTLPLVALSSGSRVERLLAEHFGAYRSRTCRCGSSACRRT
jgi:predicted acylesterase/phospholipase RssA